MKIGVTQIILRNLSLDDTLGLCQDAGYEAIELVLPYSEANSNPGQALFVLSILVQPNSLNHARCLQH